MDTSINSDLPKQLKPYRRAFPNLSDDNYEETSKYNPNYNCIGHAAGSKKWWQPIKVLGFKTFWPLGATREKTVAAYIQAYETEGYATCDDGELEIGFEKVAIYALNGAPKHAAVQLQDGRWSSKLGKEEDIAHRLQDLEGNNYGTVCQYMRRRRAK